MIDIHCHLLPGLDDGPKDWEQTFAMARIAIADGTQGVIVTPHQLGRYRANSARTIRALTTELSSRLRHAELHLEVVPGGEARIELDLISELKAGRVLTLGDHGRHVLLELPQEIYFPLQPVLDQLRPLGLTPILAHPERNRGLQSDARHLEALVDSGCLLQVTAGSYLGQFGTAARDLAEQLLLEGQLHLVASDGHNDRTRTPQLRAARERISELCGEEVAQRLCETYPQQVFDGQLVPQGRWAPPRRTWRRIFSRVA